MAVENYKSHEQEIAEIDERVRETADALRKEGYDFELVIPNESIIVLRAGGKELNFTKKETYDIKDGGHKAIEEVIAERIKELG